MAFCLLYPGLLMKQNSSNEGDGGAELSLSSSNEEAGRKRGTDTIGADFLYLDNFS